MIKYNKENYTQEIILGDINGNGIFNTNKTTVLFNDNIREIKLYNDLENSTPKAHISFEDIGGKIIQGFEANGSLIIKVKITHEITDSVFEHTYIVDSIVTVNKKSSSIIYRFECTSNISLMLNSKIEYSSGSKIKANSIIAYEMLKRAKAPTKHQRGFIESNNESHYISPVNATVKEAVDNILSYTIAPSTGWYYLVTGQYDTKCTLVNPITVFNNEIYTKFPNFEVTSAAGFADTNQAIFDIESRSYIKGSDYNSFAEDDILNSYNHTTRKWTSFNYNMQQQNVSDYIANGFKKICTSIDAFISQQYKYGKEHTPFSQDKIREKLHKKLYYGDVLQFKTMGHVHRDIGELVHISAKDSGLDVRYGGDWLIVRIYHKFSGSSYTNEYIVVRSTKKDTASSYLENAMKGLI